MQYMLIIAGPEVDQQEEMSPDQMREVLAAWSDIDKQILEAGQYIAGAGLQPSATATTVRADESGERIVSDGPFAETKEQVGGFYMIDCENLDQALAWAKKLPIQPGTSVEVRPVMDFTEFGYEDPNEVKVATS